MLRPTLPFAQAKCGKLFLVVLLLSGFMPFTGTAQKITENKVWSSLKKAPVMQLRPQYKTYSVVYDFGTLPGQPKETPELQDLKLLNSGGDATLKITLNKLSIISKSPITETPEANKPPQGQNPKQGSKPQKSETAPGGNKYYSIVNFVSNYGYELIDRKADVTDYSYKRKADTFTTPTFNSAAELDSYLKNSLESDILAHLLTKINKRIKYDFSPQNFEVRVTVNSIIGPSPAYTEITKATTDFITNITDKAPQKEAIQPQIAVWEKHLANADWKGKGAINKRVANALIENLCAAYMLTGDFKKLKEKVDLFETNNPGVAGKGSALAFEADQNYPGANPTLQAIKRKDKMQDYVKSDYHEFYYELVGE